MTWLLGVIWSFAYQEGINIVDARFDTGTAYVLIADGMIYQWYGMSESSTFL